MDQVFNKKFTISQFAEIHSINKKTLIYYDNIGLFSPSETKENGYRYYTFEQIMVMQVILLLRKIRIPLKEIKNYLKNYTQENLAELLQTQNIMLEQEIAELKWLQKIVKNKISSIREDTKIDLQQIKIIKEPQQRIILSNCIANIQNEKKINFISSFMSECYQHQLYNGFPLGFIVDAQKLQKTKFRTFKNCFYKTDEKSSEKMNITCKPAGNYLVAYYKGDFRKLDTFYDKLIEFADTNKLKFGQNAYEERVVETATKEDPYHVEAKISIQIK